MKVKAAFSQCYLSYRASMYVQQGRAKLNYKKQQFIFKSAQQTTKGNIAGNDRYFTSHDFLVLIPAMAIIPSPDHYHTKHDLNKILSSVEMEGGIRVLKEQSKKMPGFQGMQGNQCQQVPSILFAHPRLSKQTT